ncbi:transporter substrate-binding domain-containing protein [uncultured Pseudacidovorax sp.]|uniref:transporter substrate-binding domain-containing protein n=1 Tax=uncultured Pseudacidovorax sp. TaxID=679313 RepID=UPI0025D632D3|nr:transporter substrate-binding domain-containing protein [uncultured Pseudacidovorax sp.]
MISSSCSFLRGAVGAAALLAWLAGGTALAQVQAAPAGAAAMAGSATLDAARARGSLRVGNKFGFQTFAYPNARTGELEGFMADLGRALAVRLGGPGAKAEFRQTTDETRFDMLDRGDIDVLVDLTTTSDEKKARAELSDEIFRSGQGLMVRRGSPVRGLADIHEGTRVLYVTANDDVDVLKARAPKATYIAFPDSRAAAAALKAGQGDVMTQVVTHLYRAASQDPDFVVVARYTDKPYAVAVRKGDMATLAAVDGALRDMRAKGELDRLFAQWFGPYGGLAAQ